MGERQGLSPAEARAGLRHVQDSQPGIRRVRARRAFAYVDADGRAVTDGDTLARIRALVIPPAWEDVWICASPQGHLQATGRDQRGRKQYRYHAAWRRVRDTSKFGRMIDFGDALPRLRARVDADLGQRGLTREKVLATIVRLLDTTAMRVGNSEYARDNGSFGLTTLRDRHVEAGATRLTFRFRGKSGKEHEVDVYDARIARIVRRCRELPGYDLFQYVDGAGETHSVGSHDVNAYLHEAAGAEFTAKDFRTWAGTVCCAVALRGLETPASTTAAERRVREAMQQVAAALGNSVAVCRASYVHPDVVAGYRQGTLAGVRASRSKWLSADERATLAFLRAAARRA